MSNMEEFLAIALKDHEIVARLKKRIEELAVDRKLSQLWFLHELEKILENKD